MATRSLGQLTLDVVARVGGFEQGMDKAARSAEKRMRRIRRSVNDAARVVGVSFGAMTAAAGALVNQTIRNAEEIENLARVAGTAPREFQRLTYAAEQYGVQQDKVADVLKDVQDRVGDFLQTGAGPMADFFENIAPAVGVTADQFARLSGRGALQLYVDSLERANVSQSEMTFYLEAIAGDASRLLPVLRDGGSEIRRLGDEAERTGAIMTDFELDQLEEASDTINRLQGVYRGLSNEVVANAVPALNEFADTLSDPETISAVETLAETAISSFTSITEFIREAIGLAQFLGDEFAALKTGPAADDIVRIREEIERLQSLRESLPTSGSRVEGFIPDLELGEALADPAGLFAEGGLEERARQFSEYFSNFEYLTNDDIDARIEELRDKLETAQERAIDELRRNQKETAELAQQLPADVAGIDPYANLDFSVPQESIFTRGIEPIDMDSLPQKRSSREFDKTVSQIERLIELDEELGRVERAVMTDSERARADAREQLETLNAAYEEGIPIVGGYEQAVQRVSDGLEEQLRQAEGAADEMSEYWKSAARNMQSAFADFLFDPFSEGLDGMLEQFGQILQRMAAEAAAAQVFDSIGEWGQYNSGAGGWVGAVAGIASEFAGSFATGGSIPSGQWGIAGERGPEIVQGPATVVSGDETRRMMRNTGGGGPNVQIGKMEFPNVRTEREARQATGAAAREMSRVAGSGRRYS